MKEFLCFVPGAGTAPSEQAHECLVELRAALRERGLRPGHILKLAFFVRASGPADYLRKKRSAVVGLRAFFPGSRPAVGVIAQPPEKGRDVVLEAVVLRRPSRSIEVIPKCHRGVPYVLIRTEGGREVLAGGISGGVKVAFGKAVALLAREGMGLADIVRQWNFIEDIVGFSSDGGRCRQNYQIFNDIRAIAYDNAGLRAGFPAATGIGMNAGGFILEMIAGAGTAAEKSFPVSNPRQVDAHRYSRGVLVGEPLSGRSTKKTPRFERASVVFSGNAGTCWVSGTAAIVGEDVVGRGDVAEQTRTTIRTIERLVARPNLRAAGVPLRSLAPAFTYVRTYVKNERDIPEVRKIVRRAFGKAPALFLVSDICRDDLLVEIEGAVAVRAG
jgi:enamine deaminase RidA (YjgF/YER057c/UK114 family)